jgi:hypothetical protein
VFKEINEYKINFNTMSHQHKFWSPSQNVSFPFCGMIYDAVSSLQHQVVGG